MNTYHPPAWVYPAGLSLVLVGVAALVGSTADAGNPSRPAAWVALGVMVAALILAALCVWRALAPFLASSSGAWGSDRPLSPHVPLWAAWLTYGRPAPTLPAGSSVGAASSSSSAGSSAPAAAPGALPGLAWWADLDGPAAVPAVPRTRDGRLVGAPVGSIWNPLPTPAPAAAAAAVVDLDPSAVARRCGSWQTVPAHGPAGSSASSSSSSASAASAVREDAA